MNRLHGRDNAVLTELGQVDRIDDLRMLDAPAPITREAFGNLYDRVQCILIRRGPDGVDRGLEIPLGGAHQYVAQFGGASERKSGIARIVGIGLLQPCAPAAECAVEIDLDPVHAQLVVIKPWRRPGAGNKFHLLGTGGIGHDPHRKGAFVSCPAIRLPVLYGRSHVRDCSDPVTVQDLLCFCKGKVALVRARRRNGARHQFFCGIDEHARGLL